METDRGAAGDTAPPAGDDYVALSAIYSNIKSIYVCMFVVDGSRVFSIPLPLQHNNDNNSSSTNTSRKYQHSTRLPRQFLDSFPPLMFFFCLRASCCFAVFLADEDFLYLLHAFCLFPFVTE